MLCIRSLPGKGERAYAHAKACGIIGKSFFGKKLRNLEMASRLSELDRIIFPASSQNLPEKELLVDLEKRIIAREVASIISIAECFSRPPEFFRRLIQAYEYADLMTALTASLEKEKTAPAHTDLGPFQTVRFHAWPDIPAMIEGTEFDFLLDKKNSSGQEQGMSLQNALDKHYYNALWASLFSLPPRDRQAAAKILADEISLKNCCWVLRLRTYYGMRSDDVKSHLIDIPAASGKKQRGKNMRSLADDALECLEFPLDDFSAWSSWRWKEFLNPENSGSHWHAAPRHFQNSASRHLFHLARYHFRLNFFSLGTIFCYVRLKQYEEDVLTSSAEGLGIGMSVKDILSMMGLES